MNLLSTIDGSLLEGFFPAGWDLAKIDACVDDDPQTITDRQSYWHKRFEPIPCDSVADFDTLMGHEIAVTIKRARDAGEQLAMILPVGPMGMYRWAVYFLKEWGVSCDHVHGFNMDEWSDADGNTLPAGQQRRVSVRDGAGILRPAGQADRAEDAAELRHERRTCRPMARRSASCKASGAKLARHLRHRPRLSHRLLGTAFRRRVRFARRTGKPRRTASGRSCIR